MFKISWKLKTSQILRWRRLEVKQKIFKRSQKADRVDLLCDPSLCHPATGRQKKKNTPQHHLSERLESQIAKSANVFRNREVLIFTQLAEFHWCLRSPQIKQTQDEEKKQLTALRDLIKSSLQLDQKEVGSSRSSSPAFVVREPDGLPRSFAPRLLSLRPPRRLLQHRASAQCCTMLVASVW